MVGVWDTVASVGVIMGKTLPFVGVNSTIRVFRQALALDEHRTKFQPNFFHRAAPKTPATKDGDKKSKSAQDTAGGETDEQYDTNEKEVWFVGCHTDVGGGSTPDTDAYAVADIPLRWMLQEIVQAECGIQFDYDALAKWGIPTNIGRDTYTATSPAADQTNGSGTSAGGPVTENPSDALDVVKPIHDQLKALPVWWLLEIIPTSYTYQNMKNNWITKWSIHFGRGRYVPPEPKFHESVRLRMQDPKLKYKPKAKYTPGTETYVT